MPEESGDREISNGVFRSGIIIFLITLIKYGAQMLGRKKFLTSPTRQATSGKELFTYWYVLD